MNSVPKTISTLLHRNLVFVHGKGGVGKTAVSHAIALGLSKEEKTLWITLEDPTLPPGAKEEISPNLWHLNADFTKSFEEYASLKIGGSHLTRIFLNNKLIRYLANAAPGIRELVLLGKIWFERDYYTHVVVDMPSTGYGLAFFQSTENFSKLFKGGPLHRDSEAMLETFRSSEKAGHLIVALPEEMPLRESIELNEFLVEIFPNNPAAFLVNRVFPAPHSHGHHPKSNPAEWPSPFANSAEDFVLKRVQLEHHNMRIWRDEKISFGELDYMACETTDNSRILVQQLSEQLLQKAYL